MTEFLKAKYDAVLEKLSKRKATLSETEKEVEKLSQVETEEAGIIEINDDGTTSAPDGTYTIKDGSGVQIEVKDGKATIIEPTADSAPDEVKQEETKPEDKAAEHNADADKIAELEAKVAELTKELEDEKAKNTQLAAAKTEVEVKLSQVSKAPAAKRLVMSTAEDEKPLTEKEKRIKARLSQHLSSLD